MNTARISVLLQPFLESPLTGPQLEQISIYIDLLQRWNARINLTAIRHEEEIVTRHFGESFFMARHLFPNPYPLERSEGRTGIPGHPVSSGPSTDHWPLAADHCAVHVLDIGSGAGFPALPLKIWAPSLHLTLIESNHKKAAFLREVTRALTLTDINVIVERAETLSARPDRPRTEVVTLRAVEHFEAILPQALAFQAPKGTLALLVGSSQLPHLQALTTMKCRPAIPVPNSKTRVLSILVQQ